MDLVKNMKPRNIGPSGMSGRVTAIDRCCGEQPYMLAGTDLKGGNTLKDGHKERKEFEVEA